MMQDIIVSPELRASFDTLKSEATSIGDIKAWLEANPSCYLGGLPDSIVERSSISLSANMDFLIQSFRHNSLPLTLTTKIYIKLQQHPLLAEDLWQSGSTESKALEMSSTLHLNLKEWPLATALLVTRFISTSIKSAGREWIKPREAFLDNLMGIHFPGCTMGKLVSMMDAGLLHLRTHNNGVNDHSELMSFLYNARRPYSPLDASVMPQDMA